MKTRLDAFIVTFVALNVLMLICLNLIEKVSLPVEVWFQMARILRGLLIGFQKCIDSCKSQL